MSMFTLAISCLTTSNLPWSMDLTVQVPIAILLFTASDFTYITSHIHTWVLFFALALSLHSFFLFFFSILFIYLFFFFILHSFWSFFSTLLQECIEHLPTWRVYLSVSYIFAFSYCSWGSQGKNIEVVCHYLLHWTMFCQNSPPWPVLLGWPYMAWLIVSLS